MQHKYKTSMQVLCANTNSLSHKSSENFKSWTPIFLYCKR